MGSLMYIVYEDGGDMAVEDGVWIMKGVDWNHPEFIHTIEELEQYIGEVGFLPLFANDVVILMRDRKEMLVYVCRPQRGCFFSLG